MQRLIPVSLIFLCTAVFGDLAQDVRCRETGFSKSIEAMDQKRFTSYLDEDVRFVGHSVTRGPEAVTEAWKAFFDEGGPKIKWRPQFVEVLENGELALTRGPFRMIVTDEDGNTTENWGTFNSVWRLKADGEWKVVFDAGSPASEKPSDEVSALLDADDTCMD
jgi:ketosteroid isomerase-like protein